MFRGLKWLAVDSLSNPQIGEVESYADTYPWLCAVGGLQ